MSPKLIDVILSNYPYLIVTQMAQSSVIRGLILIAVVLQLLALTTSSPQTAYNSPKNFMTCCPEGSRRFIAISVP